MAITMKITTTITIATSITIHMTVTMTITTTITLPLPFASTMTTTITTYILSRALGQEAVGVLRGQANCTSAFQRLSTKMAARRERCEREQQAIQVEGLRA